MQPNLARLFALDGRRALVTGASSGLGRHFAMTLAAAGAEVVVTARRQAPLQALVEAIEVAGGRAQAFALDVTCREDICRVLDAAGPLDVLVNNAGVSDSQATIKAGTACSTPTSRAPGRWPRKVPGAWSRRGRAAA